VFVALVGLRFDCPVTLAKIGSADPGALLPTAMYNFPPVTVDWVADVRAMGLVNVADPSPFIVKPSRVPLFTICRGVVKKLLCEPAA
jgi:hypothetical protein